MPQTGEKARLRACEALHVELWRNFTYVRDRDQFKVGDDWRSHIEAFLAGQPWQDDCDGFAMTALDAVVQKGLALPEEVALHTCLVDTQVDRLYDHCVGSVDIDGVTWLFDNIARDRLITMNSKNYVWYSHKRYHGTDGWHLTVMT